MKRSPKAKGGKVSVSALEYLAAVMRDPEVDQDRRIRCATVLAAHEARLQRAEGKRAASDRIAQTETPPHLRPGDQPAGPDYGKRPETPKKGRLDPADPPAWYQPGADDDEAPPPGRVN